MGNTCDLEENFSEKLFYLLKQVIRIEVEKDIKILGKFNYPALEISIKNTSI